jgi:hypothetical protein
MRTLLLVLRLIKGRARPSAPDPRRKVELLTNRVCLPHLTSNFQLALCSTSQFSASFLPTPHGDSSLAKRVPNPLDGESDEFISTDSEGYVETEVEWFDEPHVVDVGKQNPSKRSEAVAIEVSFCCIFLPHTNHLSLEAPLG